jgi:hypothetical protein
VKLKNTVKSLLARYSPSTMKAIKAVKEKFEEFAADTDRYSWNHALIRRYAREINASTFVETGTLYGDTIHAVRDDFDQIYTIEIEKTLYLKATARFRHLSHIHTICGDSGEMLKMVLPKINTPAVFWLDGHYSGGDTGKGLKDTPIMEELSSILSSNHKGIILIDDARMFNGEGDYPMMSSLKEMILAKNKGSSISRERDVLIVKVGKGIA